MNGPIAPGLDHDDATELRRRFLLAPRRTGQHDVAC
jgi:hypothetical protein